MDHLHLTQHISQQYNNELETVRRQLLAMGGLVEEQLAVALRGLTERNTQRAAEVLARETRIDALEVEIDDQCTFILVRRQPAASDLRLVLAVLKMTSNIERIGDEAQRIARLADSAAVVDFDAASLHKFDLLGQQVRGVLRGALDAFARADPTLALQVIQRDRQVDSDYADLIRDLTAQMMAMPICVPVALDLLWSSKSLERIGDRAKNLCEYVIYMVQGEDVRHTKPNG